MNRRRFLNGAFALAATGLGDRARSRTFPLIPRIHTSARTPRTQGPLPNILLIMSDEHDPAVSGCYGDPVARTPHLDALAAEGILFENCYTNSPLCVPSRLSFLSGRYISHVGAWHNAAWLPFAGIVTLPRVLNAGGYASYLAGKMHLDFTRRYGLAELMSSFANLVVKTGRNSRVPPLETRVFEEIWLGRIATACTGDYSPVLEHDQQVTNTCCHFLAHRSVDDPPFFLIAGYLAPHFPLTVPPGYPEHYLGRVPMPVIPDGYDDTLPFNYQVLRRRFGVTAATEEQTRRGREHYWALVEWLDHHVGKLLDVLAWSGLAENTVVVYTADHGENKGDHGMWWKNCMFESAARVPLIVRWPGRWSGGQRRSGPCSLLDLNRTLIDLAGLEAPPDWAGTPLCDWLDHPDQSWEGVAVSEYYGHNVVSGFAMLRRGDFKYVYHSPVNQKHGPEQELYDLRADPHELHNLAGAPEQGPLAEAMHTDLVGILGEQPEDTELRCRAEQALGYGRTKAKAYVPFLSADEP